MTILLPHFLFNMGKIMTPKFIYLPCNSRARWDYESDMGYRCETCFAMVGSIGQPQTCVDKANKYKMYEKLGGEKWNYETGKTEYE